MSLNPYNRSYLLLAATLFCSFLFAVLTILVESFDHLQINTHVSQFINSLGGFNLNKAMIVISLIGDKYIVIPTSAIAGIIFWSQGKKHFAWNLFGVVVLAALSAHLFKIVVAYPRPGIMTDILGSFSYPSRHITICTAYLIFLYSILCSDFKHYFIGAIVISLLIIAESLSRILLDAHWFTDILGGIFLGASCGFLGAANFFRSSEVVKNRKFIIITLVVIFLVLSTFYSILFWQKMISDYIH